MYFSDNAATWLHHSLVFDCTLAASWYTPKGVGWQLGAEGGLTGGTVVGPAGVEVDDGGGGIEEGGGAVEVDDGGVDVEDGVVEVDDGGADVEDGVVEVEDGVVEVEDGVVEVGDEGRMDVERVDGTGLVADEAVGDAPVAVDDSDSDIGVAAAGPLLLGMLMA